MNMGVDRCVNGIHGDKAKVKRINKNVSRATHGEKNKCLKTKKRMVTF